MSEVDETKPVAEESAEGIEVEKDLDALLADAEAKKDEYLELAKRTQADFENYRKRMAAEVQAAALRGKGQMARELIEAVDNLERALESAGESPDGLAGGVEMVLRGMREALTRNGIEAVDPKERWVEIRCGHLAAADSTSPTLPTAPRPSRTGRSS